MMKQTLLERESEAQSRIVHKGSCVPVLGRGKTKIVDSHASSKLMRLESGMDGTLKFSNLAVQADEV